MHSNTSAVRDKLRRGLARQLGEGSTVPEEYIIPPVSPFDMFAISATLLSKSGAYHHFEGEADYFGQPNEELRRLNRIERVPVSTKTRWQSIGKIWHDLRLVKHYYQFMFQKGLGPLRSIASSWLLLLKNWDSPAFMLLPEDENCLDWWNATYFLTVVSDEASRDVGFKFFEELGDKVDSPARPDSKEKRTLWSVLAQSLILCAKDARDGARNRRNETMSYVESLSLATRGIVNVLPKSKTAPLGCALRCLTHNLACLPGTGTIRVGWAWARNKPARSNRVFNLLLVPYPYEIRSRHFLPTTHSADSNLRTGTFKVNVKGTECRFADFEFLSFFRRLLKAAKDSVGSIHGVVFPELALSWISVEELVKICREQPDIELLCSGVREHPNKTHGKNGSVSANGAFMAAFGHSKKNQKSDDQHLLFHEKHHRWRLTEQQILDYGLASSLDPSRIWWEDIRIVNRKLPFVVLRDKWVVTTLICEDLARNDPSRPVVEAIGPNLVISLLMDGPQIQSRWPARYSSVLADDPGSSVLSMTSFGLVRRSSIVRSQNGESESDCFALWRDDTQTKEISLDPKSHGVVLGLTEYPTVDCTLDGRLDSRATSLRLTRTLQISTGEINSETGVALFPPWDAEDTQ